MKSLSPDICLTDPAGNPKVFPFLICKIFSAINSIFSQKSETYCLLMEEGLINLYSS